MSVKQLLSVALPSAFVASLVLFLGLRLVGDPAAGAPGPGFTHYQKENFLYGLSAGRIGQFEIRDNGILNSSSSFILQGTSTFRGEITLGNCGTLSYTIPALSPRLATNATGYVSTTVAVPGAALGDVALVSNNSSTNALSEYGIVADASISAAAIATVMFSNVTNVTSTAVTTSTITVCYFD